LAPGANEACNDQPKREAEADAPSDHIAAVGGSGARTMGEDARGTNTLLRGGDRRTPSGIG
jgi:hypothetical protein